MNEQFLRTEMILGSDALERLRQCHVAVFGLGADAEACGQSMAEYALRWILCQRGVTSVLVGASSTEQLAKNLRCLL